MEGITILPIVIPPVVLIVGVLQLAPGSLKSTPYLLALVYVVLAMPFAYRRSTPGCAHWTSRQSSRRRTRWAPAGRTRCGGWCCRTCRTALLSAVVLTVALVLGEYTMASLALYQTFPVWIYVNEPDQRSGLGRGFAARAVRDLALPAWPSR